MSQLADIAPTFIAKFFGLARSCTALQLSSAFLTLIRSEDPVRISLVGIASLETRRQLAWTRFELVPQKGETLTLGGFRIAAAREFLSAVEVQRSKAIAVLEFDVSALQLLAAEVSRFLDGQSYACHEEGLDLHAQCSGFLPQLENEDEELEVELAALGVGDIALVRDLFRELEGSRLRANSQFLEFASQADKNFFETVESQPLTLEQRHAALTDDNRTRVIASAGSGKSSVIVAKAGYLIAKGICAPEEVLCLSFSKAAVDELSERMVLRLTDCSGVGEHAAKRIKVKTFHGLGLEVLGETLGSKPIVSTLATDDKACQAFIHDVLVELLEDERLSESILACMFPEQSINPLEFKSPEEYRAYIRKSEIRSLSGIKVKSAQECKIANFFFRHGIEFEYEMPYPHGPQSAFHMGYQPDFYLPQYDLYLEHFGVDRRGNTAPGIDSTVYLRDMEWKRALHKEKSTTLLETFSYEDTEGGLIERLKQQLTSHGVPELVKMTVPELLELKVMGGKLGPLEKTLHSALNHLRSQGLSISEYRTKIAARIEQPTQLKRVLAFADVLGAVVSHYDVALAAAGEVDFSDMIRHAAESIRNEPTCQPGFKRILVDEFQDISRARAELIRALVAKTPGARLFVVGDDWQAIYRFAGSDLSLMTEFEREFGVAQTCNLTRTFRFDQTLCDFSRLFIENNPSQLTKKVEGNIPTANQVAVEICFGDEEEHCKNILSEISQQRPGASVLFLGRYRKTPEYHDSLCNEFSSLKIERLTVHRSKGMTRDFTIVEGLRSAALGFPCKKGDDPAVAVLLAEEEAFDFAEERRLFYVAVTRSKYKTFLLADRKKPSEFIVEVMKQDWPYHVRGKSPSPSLCPECNAETVRAPRRWKADMRCSMAPQCDWEGFVCRTCKVSPLKPDGLVYRCANAACTGQEFNCPGCVTGRGQVRQGKNGRVFVACTERCSEPRSLCPSCKDQPLLVDENTMDRKCVTCGLTQQKCEARECDGWMTPRKGSNGPFLGCTNFSNRSKNCKATRSA